MEYSIVDLKTGLKYSVSAHFEGAIATKGGFGGQGMMRTSLSVSYIEAPDGTIADVELLNPKLTYKSGKGVW